MRLPHALRCLARPNLQLFFGGQVVSLVGTWAQSVAQQWLIWRLTHSAVALGAVAFLGQFPVFLFGTLGGSLADRLPRRRLVITTQALAALQALAFAVDTLWGTVTPLHVYVLATWLGLVNAFDMPARQALLTDLAHEDMGNAIALNSSVVNGARVIGPAVAGYLVALVGEGVCFLGNALSYMAILLGLAKMRIPDELRPRPRRGHLREGLRYAVRTPHVRALFGLLAATSFFGLSYAALMPVFAAQILHGGARLLGTLFAAVGLGALVAAVLLLRHEGFRGLGRRAGFGALLLGASLIGFSLSRNAVLSTIALFFVGLGFMSQTAATNTLVQGLAPPTMRGRVMGLFSTIFIGMTPLGAVLAGWLSARLGAPLTVALGSIAVAASSVAYLLAVPRLRQSVMRSHPHLFPPRPDAAAIQSPLANVDPAKIDTHAPTLDDGPR